MTIIVADSGPLIALAALDALQLPASLWERLIAPQSVFDECAGLAGKPGAQSILGAVEAGWIEVQPDSAVDEAVAAYCLDPGESQAMALARRLQAGLLIDEQRGRKAASKLQIRHIGTCGVLVIAKRRGLVPEIKPLLDRLGGAGYFLSPQLVLDTLRLAEEI